MVPFCGWAAQDPGRIDNVSWGPSCSQSYPSARPPVAVGGSQRVPTQLHPGCSRGTGAHPSSHEPGLVLRTDPEQCSVYGEGAEAVQGSGEQTHPPAIRPPWTFTAGLTCQALGTRSRQVSGKRGELKPTPAIPQQNSASAAEGFLVWKAVLGLQQRLRA